MYDKDVTMIAIPKTARKGERVGILNVSEFLSFWIKSKVNTLFYFVSWTKNKESIKMLQIG